MKTYYPFYDYAGTVYTRRHYPERSYLDISVHDQAQNLSLVFTGKDELERLIKELQTLLDDMTI